jgi:wyosine [tRNA(Phe)-imidazoG37] synthetase (radical SAM superfamily)
LAGGEAADDRGGPIAYNEAMADKRLEILHHAEARRAFTMHARTWQDNRYVYPVVSRRSHGISIGVNLNTDKLCNFDCIYCSVDRTGEKHETQNTKHETRDGVDLGVLRAELEGMLAVVRSGEIFTFDPFDKIPATLRRVNDVAFSGDGEPTSCRNFGEACRLAAEILEGNDAATRRHGDAANDERIKIVVITNATLFHQPQVRQALAFLDQHNGEIWAKLDAGSPEYYQLIDRTAVPFARVLENVKWCCQSRPTVIQTLMMRVHGEAPPVPEVDAYVGRLKEIVNAAGRIKLVQLYTVARRTTEAYATPLTAEELDGIAQRLRAEIPGISVEVYP